MSAEVEADLGLALMYRPQIWGRMMAEHAADLSDQTIELTLGPCVSGHILVPLAKLLRDRSLLELTAAGALYSETDQPAA